MSSIYSYLPSLLVGAATVRRCIFCTGGPVLKGGDSYNANCHIGKVSLSESYPDIS